MKLKFCRIKSINRLTIFSPLFLLTISFILKNIDFNKKDHIFILRSFYYRNSKIFTNSPKDTIVVLFNMEEHINMEKIHPICISGSGITSKKNIAKIVPLFLGEVKCKLTVYRLHCHPVDLFEPNALKIGGSLPIELEVKKADHGQKNIVVCPGRMFAFEQWHLFITAMELHRIHYVDLVVVYIQSVDVNVFKLVKLYQMNGWVKIRNSLLMPSKLNTLNYDPNSETQWNTQIVNFQECLYEFRESADFIAFPDWDDLMITTNFMPLPSILNKLRKKYPRVCSFVYGRYLGAIETLGSLTEKKYGIKKIWNDGIAFTRNQSVVQFVGKVLARPKMVTSIRFHDANLKNNCHQMHVPMKWAQMIHARNYFDYSLESKLDNVTQMIINFNKFIVSTSHFTKIIRSLPKRDSALDQFYNCLGFSGTRDMWGHIFKIVQDSTDSKCYSYARCNITRVKLAGKCMNVDNYWETNLSSKYSISILKSSSFMEEDSCIV